MRIGVISDTHDRLPTLRAALAICAQRGVDTIIHPGDIVAPFAAKLLAEFDGVVHVIFGNNDGERAGLQRVLPQIQDGPLLLTLDGRRMLVHHFVDWCDADDIARSELIISGHTHEVRVEQRDGRLFINPGECCGWVTGRATMAIVDLQSAEVEIVEVPT